MAFPKTPVLDSFTRADAPTTLGADWTTGGPDSGWTSLGILSNQLYATGAFNANRWATRLVNENQEVYCAIPTRGTVGGIRLYLRLQNEGTATRNAYYIQVNQVGACEIYKVVSGSVTFLFSGTTVNSGDSVGLEAVGSRIALWRRTGAGAWTADGSVLDTSIRGGGLLCIGFPDDTSYRVDDFGGGEVPDIRLDHLSVPQDQTALGCAGAVLAVAAEVTHTRISGFHVLRLNFRVT